MYAGYSKNFAGLEKISQKKNQSSNGQLTAFEHFHEISSSVHASRSTAGVSIIQLVLVSLRFSSPR